MKRRTVMALPASALLVSVAHKHQRSWAAGYYPELSERQVRWLEKYGGIQTCQTKNGGDALIKIWDKDGYIVEKRIGGPCL